MPDIAIVGAGVAGLSAAWELLRSGCRDFVVCDGSGRAGGVMASERDPRGFLFEAGPDSFLLPKPEALQLCRELGLESEIVPTLGHGPARILHQGKLEPLPPGWRLAAPSRLLPMLRTPLLSWPAKAALLAHWRAPGAAAASATDDGDDTSVAAWLRRRYGRRAGQALADRLAGPMLAGVYGGDIERLSLASVRPPAAPPAVANGGASNPPAAPPPGAMFATLRAGMGTLAEALTAALPAGALRLNCHIRGLTARPGGGYRLTGGDGERFEAQAVILALPAPAAAALLEPVDPALAQALRAIEYGPSLSIYLAYAHAPALPSGTGFLAPRSAGARLLACTFAHQKFPHRAPAGGGLLRLFYAGEETAWPDASVEALARHEVKTILGITAEPVATRITRWPGSMPRYNVGHRRRVAAIQAALARHAGLGVAGNAYGGVGVPDCIRAGRAAARAAGGGAEAP